MSRFFSKNFHRNFFHFLKKNKKIITYSSVIVFLFGLTIFSFFSRVAAETVLVPSACLGGWDNPSKAVGMPESILVDKNSFKFSSDNSASVKNKLAEIYCGNFSGDIPKDTKPTAILINFSWAFIPKDLETTVPASPADLSSGTSSVLDAPSDASGSSIPLASSTEKVDNSATGTPVKDSSPSVSPEVSPSENKPTISGQENSTGQNETQSPADATPSSSGAGDSPTTPAPQPTAPTPPAPEVPKESPPQGGSQTNPTSFLFKALSLFVPNTVYAETSTTSDQSSTTSKENITVTILVDSIATTSAPSTDTLLEISYTLDGSTWHNLGTVNRSNFSMSSFVVPVDLFPEWTDLEKLQVKVTSFSNTESDGTIYLDGMRLLVEYQKSSAEVKDKKTAEQEANFLSNLPEADLSVSSILSRNDDFKIEPTESGDGKSAIKLSSKSEGNLFVYRNSDNTLFMSSGIGLDPTIMPLYFFPPDVYNAILIKDPNECGATKTLSECREAGSFVGESSFVVTFSTSSTSVSSDGKIK